MKYLVVLAALCVLGCSEEKKSKSDSFTYSYNINGCKTGQHSFSTKAEFCEALKNSELNKGCAYEMRKNKYETECGSDFAVIY